MARVVLTEAAKVDIRHALRATLEQFGAAQQLEYRALIIEARNALAKMPLLGHKREDLPPEGRVLYISQPGRAASHFFLYRLVEQDTTVQLLRLLHKSMDITRHWPHDDQESDEGEP